MKNQQDAFKSPKGLINKDEGSNMSSVVSETKKDKDFFSPGEIQQLKQKIEGINPQKLIEDALRLSKKPDEKKEKKDEFLETLKINAVKTFLDSIKNKNLREVTAEFDKRIEEYNKASILYKDKIDKEKY